MLRDEVEDERGGVSLKRGEFGEVLEDPRQPEEVVWTTMEIEDWRESVG
jgi:hypothetical protein